MKRLIVILSLFIITTGCAPTFNYTNLDNLLRAGDCAGSKEMLKKSQDKYGNKAQLIYHLDTAMTHYLCGDMTQAAEELNRADDMAQELWTLSVSDGAASFLTNDMIIDYPGEDFERALINLFSAFAYIQQGSYESALIECRQLNTLLTQLNDSYTTKNVYKEDALGRYISGILSEIDGDYSDAYIYYYEALRAYKDYNMAYGTPTPPSLYSDLLRVAEAAGRRREARRLTRGYKVTKYTPREARKRGRIVYIHLNGKAPVKVEEKFTHLAPTGPISIAFPRYITASTNSIHSDLILTEKNGRTITASATLAEDITRIAVKNLKDRKNRIWAKTISRAVAKQVAVHAAAQQMKKEQGEFAGLLTQFAGQVAASASEKADIRSWRTLPGTIYMTSRFVEPGEYTATASINNGAPSYLETVRVKAGDTVFIFNTTRY